MAPISTAWRSVVWGMIGPCPGFVLPFPKEGPISLCLASFALYVLHFGKHCVRCGCVAGCGCGVVWCLTNGNGMVCVVSGSC